MCHNYRYTFSVSRLFERSFLIIIIIMKFISDRMSIEKQYKAITIHYRLSLCYLLKFQSIAFLSRTIPSPTRQRH